MKILFIFLMFFYFVFAGVKVEVGCNHYRPFVDEINGKPVGIGYEIAKEVLKKAGIEFEYKVLPWARVYYYGLHKKNYMIGCLGRTAYRENKFYWIGPMEKGVKLYFYALKSNPINLKSVEEAKKYKIAVEKDTYNEQFLTTHNFPKENIKSVIKKIQMLKMLKNRRVDLILLNDKELKAAAKKININPDIFKKVIYVFTVQSYLAFSKNTPKEIVEKVKKAYKELKKEGKIKLK